MFDRSKVLAVVPARKGSSFKDKNIFPVAGKPLIEYTLDAVREVNIPCVITSDDERVLAYHSYYGFMRDDRPVHLSDDKATLNAVLSHVVKKYPFYEYYLLLPPTSPLRTSEDINKALEIFFDSGVFMDSLFSCTEERRGIFKSYGTYSEPIVERKKNRQEEQPIYIVNGAIFIASKHLINLLGTKTGGRTCPYVMPEARSVDVHNEKDISLCEFYLKK